MPQPLRLFFIRHGETDWNVEARLQGQKDIPINALGREQAAEAGRRLATLAIDPGTLPWLASPLHRTRDTCERARAAIGLDPSHYALDDRLKEISFGQWEGMTWREVRRADPASARAREHDKWAFRPPGGESYAMLAERMRPFADEAAGDIVVVSHGGVARALLWLLARVPESQAPNLDIWQGRVLVIERGRHAWH